MIAAVDLPESYDTTDCMTGYKAIHSITLQYQNLSPPQNTSFSITTPQREHLPLDPSQSSGSETSSTNMSSPHRGRKKILTAHVLKSRDSSPSEAVKLPPLTKPKLFTPPQHRRLCKTGTGGLLDRPTTPDPFFDESDESLSGSLTDMTCMSLPTTLPSIATMPMIMTESFEVSSTYSARHSPASTTTSDQLYVSPQSSVQSASSRLSDKNTNNNSSSGSGRSHLHALDSSTLGVPLMRMGRRMTYDIAFAQTPRGEQRAGSKDDQCAPSADQYLTVGSHTQARRLSTGAVCVQERTRVETSPLLGHKVVLEDNARQPKYV